MRAVLEEVTSRSTAATDRDRHEEVIAGNRGPLGPGDPRPQLKYTDQANRLSMKERQGSMVTRKSARSALWAVRHGGHAGATQFLGEIWINERGLAALASANPLIIRGCGGRI